MDLMRGYADLIGCSRKDGRRGPESEPGESSRDRDPRLFAKYSVNLMGFVSCMPHGDETAQDG